MDHKSPHYSKDIPAWFRKIQVSTCRKRQISETLREEREQRKKDLKKLHQDLLEIRQGKT